MSPRSLGPGYLQAPHRGMNSLSQPETPHRGHCLAGREQILQPREYSFHHQDPGPASASPAFSDLSPTLFPRPS